MTTHKEALTLALEDLKWIKLGMGCKDIDATIQSIEEALAQPEQELVVVMELYTVGWDLVENIDIDWLESLPFGTKLYAHSPVRKLGITEEEFKNDKYA